MTISIHTVTTTVVSRHARGEARFVRQHTGSAPEPTAMPATILRIAGNIIGGILLAALILACVFV